MSRSRKKQWGFSSRNSFAKKQANKVVRRYKDNIENGGFYKKLYESYDICDFRCIYDSMLKLEIGSKRCGFPIYHAWMK